MLSLFYYHSPFQCSLDVAARKSGLLPDVSAISSAMDRKVSEESASPPKSTASKRFAPVAEIPDEERLAEVLARPRDERCRRISRKKTPAGQLPGRAPRAQAFVRDH